MMYSNKGSSSKKEKVEEEEVLAKELMKQMYLDRKQGNATISPVKNNPKI